MEGAPLYNELSHAQIFTLDFQTCQDFIETGFFIPFPWGFLEQFN